MENKCRNKCCGRYSSCIYAARGCTLHAHAAYNMLHQTVPILLYSNCCPHHMTASAAFHCNLHMPVHVPLWSQVLLLDEITVDLDVLGRAELMRFLQVCCPDSLTTIRFRLV